MENIIKCNRRSFFSIFLGASCRIPGTSLFFLQILLIIIFLVNAFSISAVQARLIQGVIEIPSSFNPVGSGARALGMGGAFIAVADDATAASWNPAGLIQLESPEISMVGAYIKRTEDNTFTGLYSDASGEQPISDRNLNYLSVSYPFSLREHNMIVSLNYQYLYDLNRKWEGLAWPVGANEIHDLSVAQNGGLGALGLAYAIQLSPQFSLGMTLNLWNDLPNTNTWKGKLTEYGEGSILGGAVPTVYEGEAYHSFEFSGVNFNLGLMWDITSMFRIGLIFKSPFSADLKHTRYSWYTRWVAGTDQVIDSSDNPLETVEETLEMPMSYGMGLSYRFSDTFTMAADLFRTEWDDYIHRDEDGVERSPISGLEKGVADVAPTYQVRFGAEYLFINMEKEWVIPVRAGIFYDPSPAEGSPDNYYGISLGTGIAYKRFVFDIAYQYRFGRDVGTAYLEEVGLSQDVDEHTMYSSVIIHF